MSRSNNQKMLDLKIHIEGMKEYYEGEREKYSNKKIENIHFNFMVIDAETRIVAYDEILRFIAKSKLI